MNPQWIITAFALAAGLSFALVAWVISRLAAAVPKQDRVWFDAPPWGYRLLLTIKNSLSPGIFQPSIMPGVSTYSAVQICGATSQDQGLANLVGRVFTADSPNACWLSDITYIPTREGWFYLAAVLDVYSRAVVRVAEHYA